MSALVKRGGKLPYIGCPNFPDGVVFKGYQNKLFQEEILEGIRDSCLDLHCAKQRHF